MQYHSSFICHASLMIFYVVFYLEFPDSVVLLTLISHKIIVHFINTISVYEVLQPLMRTGTQFLSFLNEDVHDWALNMT